MCQGERFNAITHLIGTIAAFAGTIVLIWVSARSGEPKTIVSVTIYGVTLVLLYLISTLYHSLSGRPKKVFHVLDHCGIYVLIAGTYTPFALLTLRGDWGWWFFGIVWTLAGIGIIKDSVFHRRFRWVSYVLYLGMGWLAVVAWEPLKAALPVAGMVLLFGGGIFYTGGLTFLALARRYSYGHGVWHICVLAGSACHYVAILRYVAVPAA
jgi:hemolysin III